MKVPSPVNSSIQNVVMSKTLDLGKGWSVREDQGKTSTKIQDHIHVTGPGGKEWSQNKDGTVHDKKTSQPGSAPKKAREKIKEKTGWDWDETAQQQTSSSSVIKEVSEDVCRGAAVAAGGYVLYRVIRFAPSHFPPLWLTISANLVAP